MKQTIKSISIQKLALIIGIGIMAAYGLTTSVVAQKSDAQALAEKALTQFTEGNFDDAKALADQSINSDISTALAYAVRGRVLLIEERDGEAQTDLEKAVRINPTNGVFNAFLAVCYDVKGNSQDSAKKTAERAVNLLNSPKSAIEYYARSVAYSIIERNGEADNDLTKAIGINPRFAIAYYRRGNAYNNKQQPESALADYTKAIEINPKYASPYFPRGNIYYAKQQYDLAIADYTNTIRLDPKNVAAYLNRGVAYKNKQQYDSALADYQKAVQLNPQDSDVYFNRGNVYFIQKQYDSALADYSKAIETNPKFVNAYLNRGVIYNDVRQQFDLAIADYTKAIELDPKSLNAYGNRAHAYKSVGETRLAEIDRQKFLELGGTISPAERNAPRQMFPLTSFNAELAKTQLATGSSTIRGRACSVKEGLIFEAANVTISLFPVTPYLEEWYRLRDKEEGKNTSVYMSNEASKYRIDVVTDSEGKFQFREMKPGKYFLHTIFSFNQAKSANVYVGRGNNGDGSVTDYYRQEDYIVPRSDRLEKFVEVKKEGDTVKITLSRARGLLKLGGACSVW